MQQEWETIDTNVTRVKHKSNTSATRRARVRHEWYTSNTSATRVKNSDFDNDTNKNIFLHPYICYMTSERLQREEQFDSKNYFLEMRHLHAIMHLKSAPQKLNFLMAKDISKNYTRDCSCTLMPLEVPA